MIQGGFRANFGKMRGDRARVHRGLIKKQVYSVVQWRPLGNSQPIIARSSEIFSRCFFFKSLFELGMAAVMSVNRRVSLAKIRRVLSHAGRAQE